MTIKKTLITLGALWLLLPVHAQTVQHEINFGKMKDGDGHLWMKNNNFTPEVDADDVTLTIKNGRLNISTTKPVLGVYRKKITVKNPYKLRIEWGVTKFLNGADYSKNKAREPLAFIVTFGDEPIDSGSFFIPNIPYFIGFVLNKNEVPGKLYTAGNFKKGGRYVCIPCEGKINKTFVTDVNLKALFEKAFKKPIRFVSTIIFETDTRDTPDGISGVYVKKIQFLSQ